MFRGWRKITRFAPRFAPPGTLTKVKYVGILEADSSLVIVLSMFCVRLE